MSEKKPYKFEKYNNFINKEKTSETFDKDNIFMVKAGQKINNYEFIQNSREGTEIYATIEKYGTMPTVNCDMEKTFGEFENINDMKDIYAKLDRAEELWQNLPLDIRKEFNSSKGEFLNRGGKWLADKIAKKEQKEAMFEKPEIEEPIIENKE